MSMQDGVGALFLSLSSPPPPCRNGPNFSHEEAPSSTKSKPQSLWQFRLVNLSCWLLETVSGHRVKLTFLIIISQKQTGLTSTLDTGSQERHTEKQLRVNLVLLAL